MRALLADLGALDAAIQRYGFWAGDHANPDVEPEARIAAASGADRVLALSIGTLVAMIARRTHGFRPSACIFVGTPVKRLHAEGLLGLLAEQAAAAPTLFIQQTADPTGSFAELAATLPEAAAACEVPGADHAYTDTRALAALVAGWRP
jgi:hypothetical protein